MMWWNGSGGGWGWGWLGPIFMLLFWGGLIVLVIWAVGALTRSREHPAPGGDSAVEILRRRFARGEIEQAEFEEKLRLLDRFS